MSGSQPTSLDEQTSLKLISTLIKTYESQFELEESFTPGVFGCSDPQYPTVRREWLQNLERSGLAPKRLPALESLFADILGDTERGWQESQPADSRFNWRITVHHNGYFIHVMAADKNFERFAFSLQTEPALKAGLSSDQPRPDCLRYEVVNRLSDLKPIFDDVYGIFKREGEKRRHHEEIDRAVAAERAKWEKLLYDQKERIKNAIFVAIFFVLLIIIIVFAPQIKGYFRRPINIIEAALGSGIIAAFGTALYFVVVARLGLKIGLLKDREAAPWLWRSVWVVFIVLWAALAFLDFKGII